MGFSGKYIICGIDGTASHEWNRNGRESHVSRFVYDANVTGGYKRFLDGPGQSPLGAELGLGTSMIIDSCVHWITKMTKRIIPDLREIPTTQRFSNLNASLRGAFQATVNEKLRIVIVGHSRGGLAAINIANNLPFPVYFLGLYDAVDMHPTLNCEKIVNAKFTYHAKRHPFIGSRYSWGNCGDTLLSKINTAFRNRPSLPITSSGFYEEKLFYTSHGGFGNSPTLNPKKITDDSSTNILSSKANIMKALGANPKEYYLKEAAAANAWIREKARDKGIKF